MIYVYLNKASGGVDVATNLRAIGSRSKINYHTLRHWFRNGTDKKETDEFIIWRTELIRRNKNISNKGVALQSSNDHPLNKRTPDDSSDEFDILIRS